jgi:hypothetical protein
MTLQEAFDILRRNGFSPDLIRSYATSERVYAASWETCPTRNTSVGLPRAEVSWSARLGIVCRAGNLPIE